MTPPCTSPACRRACPCPAACQLPEPIGRDSDGDPMLPLSPDDAIARLVGIVLAVLALVAFLKYLQG